MGAKLDPVLHPAAEEFDPVKTGEHLTARILSFQHPAGLIAYWRQNLNRLRLLAMPENYRRELERRYEKRLEALNDAGPY